MGLNLIHSFARKKYLRQRQFINTANIRVTMSLWAQIPCDIPIKSESERWRLCLMWDQKRESLWAAGQMRLCVWWKTMVSGLTSSSTRIVSIVCSHSVRTSAIHRGKCSGYRRNAKKKREITLKCFFYFEFLRCFHKSKTTVIKQFPKLNFIRRFHPFKTALAWDLTIRYGSNKLNFYARPWLFIFYFYPPAERTHFVVFAKRLVINRFEFLVPVSSKP